MEFWIKPEQCSGCAACANACPKNAISLKSDAQGYSTPIIDQELCVDCGLCKKACPVYKSLNQLPLAAEPKREKPTIYAAWSRTYTTRYNSTSGGVFSELAKIALQEGAYICGAVYTENQMVHHEIVQSEEGLARVRQSKYTQSETGLVFREIKGLLRQGKQVLYCGAPCQVAGLYEFLGGDKDNLTTVDFICRGINSPMAYRAWLDDLEGQFGAKATRVWFKNKECGWNKFSTRVDFANGKHYRKSRYDDLYMRAYLNHNLFIRPSCTDCQFKGLPRMGDITLADFWKIDKKLDADLGTSMVILNSEKGDSLFSKAQPNLVTHLRSYEEALKGNVCLTQSVRHGKFSKAFFRHLEEGMNFSQAFYKATETMPLVSAIVPIETATKFLSGTLSTLCAQQYPNLEILLICGSEDTQLQEFVACAAKDLPMVRLLPPEVDLVSAMNAALQASQGDYIHFCTGRERVSPNLYSTMVGEMLRTHANIGCFAWKDVSKAPRCSGAFNGTGNAQAFLELMLTSSDAPGDYSGYGAHLWNKIFRRDAVFVDDTPIEFEHCGYGLTDLIWLSQVSVNCGKAFFTSKIKLARLVPEAEQAIGKDFSPKALFAQEVRALKTIEALYPYAYAAMCRNFYDYEVKLISVLKANNFPRLAQLVAEHASTFFDIHFTNDEILEMHLRIQDLEMQVSSLQKERTFLKNKLYGSKRTPKKLLNSVLRRVGSKSHHFCQKVKRRIKLLLHI